MGTAEYVSPEVLNDAEATEASDLWAVGCILFQMVCGRPPFQAASQYYTFKKIEELDYSFGDDDDVHPHAQELVGALQGATVSEGAQATGAAVARD